MAREFRSLEPLLLEADSASAARAAFGVFDCFFGGEVDSESICPFLGGGFLDEVVRVEGVFGWEGFGGSEGVFC